eukprot:3636993-Alexandrium_andersonii.AAC.1
MSAQAAGDRERRRHGWQPPAWRAVATGRARGQAWLGRSSCPLALRSSRAPKQEDTATQPSLAHG